MRWYSQLQILTLWLAPLAFVALGAVMDATTWANKMLTRVQNSSADWEHGVANPRRSPTAAMKAAAGKWKQRMQDAITNDRWAKKIATLTDQGIADAAKAAGGARFVQGVTSRSAKIQAAIAKLQPRVQANSMRIQAMPQDTDQQREQRMVENLRGMRAIKNI